MNSKLEKVGQSLFIIPLLLASWILIHLLAIFGIFFAVAYPFWWLFAPKQTVCLLCRAGKQGQKCYFCRRSINKSGAIGPSDIFSAIFNGLLIFVFSLVSLGVIYAESQFLASLGFSAGTKTVSFVIPTKGQYRLGEIFPMKIEIVGMKVAINAVQADLGFEPDKLEVIDVSTDESFANIFVQKEINNTGGYVRLAGGLSNPGFTGDRGVFGTVFFKAKSPGVVKIEYLPSSLVLANDGRGTNILKDLAAVSYFILPEKISQEEAEMQKDLIFKSDVLGKNTDNPRMEFYQESILGSETKDEITDTDEVTGFGFLAHYLKAADNFILQRWTDLLGL